MSQSEPPKRLTQLVQGAGCAAKVGAASLAQVLRDLKRPPDSRLLVGIETGDDAGVYRLTDELALVQTLDFFPPIVDDPYLYGQIAAANALSDVYAMGGTPLTAMNIFCFPLRERDPEEAAEILRGGAEKTAEAEVALVGGHSLEDPAPKYGLSVTGTVHPDRIAANAGAKPGDKIVLTKPLGMGIVTTAAKFEECPPDVFAEACRWMSTLNVSASRAMRQIGIGDTRGVHAATDITGFGLLGHLTRLARSSGVSLELWSRELPTLPKLDLLISQGDVTRGGRENRLYLAEWVTFASAVSSVTQEIMLDPQTSGGLAIFVSEASLPFLLSALEAEDVEVRAVIGEVKEAAGQTEVRVKG